MNLFSSRIRHIVACVAIFIAGVFGAPVFAQINSMTSDGWHTWRVPAIESAPEMCCYSWNRGTTRKQGCNLDRHDGGFSTAPDVIAASTDMQIFAHLEDGDVTEIRALSASCPVTSDSPVFDLGAVEAKDSVRWLEDHIIAGNKLASEAITAVAVHEGDAAAKLLLKTAGSDSDQDNREDAIFWMTQVRVAEMSGEIKGFIFDDRDSAIREHAAFAYSQSEAADIPEVLIRQGRNDHDPDVRSQAWFWLAQTEAAESEAAIRQAMREDDDEDVRQEAVFALSQLPGDRAVKALAEILEDSGLDMEIREQALFWLAQTESDEAFEYIDRILSDN